MEIRGKGHRFGSADAFRYSIWKNAIAHQFDSKLERNCKQCIVVKCKVRGCPFHKTARGNVKAEGMVVKDFVGNIGIVLGINVKWGTVGSES